jgi:hypothetical protein
MGKCIVPNIFKRKNCDGRVWFEFFRNVDGRILGETDPTAH